MAKALKYRIEFFSTDGTANQVDFLFEGFSGSITYLDGGARPFVLREFNTNDDLFKPIRPFLAEIQIVTNSSGVSSDSFIADQDTDIEVRFYCNDLSIPYWSGFVLQDDFSESYENSNHILTITASEALGSLKDKQLSDEGVEIVNMSTPLELIEYCLQDSSKPLVDYLVFNNLYHTSMSDTLPNTCLSQAKIDPRTFETSPREYENCYTVLEKVNTAFNQNIFQYENKWVILRLEELYNTGNLRGYQRIGGVDTSISKRFDIEVGTGYEVKPVAPQMLRFINRKPKETIVTFNFDRLDEVIKNSSFARGLIYATYPTFKEYNINNWTLYRGGIALMTLVTTASAIRREEYQSNIGPIVDNFIIIPQDASLSKADHLLKSETIDVNFGEKIKLQFDVKTSSLLPSNTSLSLAFVVLEDSGGVKYTLDKFGNWYSFPSTGIYYDIELLYINSENTFSDQWNTVEVEALPLPASGTLNLYLVCDNKVTFSATYFKNLEFDILNRIDGFQVGLTAVESKFIKSANIKFNNNYNLYLNDFISESYKGLIYESDGDTPTNFEWYRYRYNGERQSFKKENAITYWSHNRYDRDKIDATFYGLKWNDGVTPRVIGLLNTIKLLDDSPNKIFYISNLKEIDFVNSTWSCTMEEIWDETRDGAAGPTRSLTLNIKTGTYNNTNTIPWNTSANDDFVVAANNLIIYQGAEPITETITISASGNFVSYIGATPVLVEFYVKQNGTTIKTQAFTISGAAPFPFTLNLSPSGTYTINPNDQFEVSFTATEVGKSITSIQFTSGSFNVSSYTVPNALNYDNYIEKYIYK